MQEWTKSRWQLDMDSDDLREFYKESYYLELETRERISSGVHFSITVVVAELGFLGFLISDTMVEEPSSSISYGTLCMMVMLIATCVVVVMVAIVYLARAFWGHDYTLMPTPAEIEAYRTKLLSTYESNENSLAKKYFDEFLILYFSDCATQISSVNDRRRYILHCCNRFVLIFILPAMLAFGLQYWLEIETTRSSSSMALEQPQGELEMADKKQPPAPPPPPPPPKRVVKNDQPSPPRDPRPTPR